MCTVSWTSFDPQWSLFFNRDELRTRSRALPPSLHRLDNVKCVFPVDPDGSGTWLGANEFGLILCMLNYYDCDQAKNSRSTLHDRPSRGVLVRDLLPSRSGSELEAVLNNTSLKPYSPFHLLVIQDERSVKHTWNGYTLCSSEVDAADLPVSTSSVKPDLVIPFRESEYPKGPISAESLRNFHYHQNASNPSFSVRMERDKTKTVSISTLSIQNRTLTFRYDDFEASPTSICLALQPPSSGE